MAVRLAIVMSHPNQHFSPMFRELAKANEIGLKVFYCCDWGLHDYVDPGFGREFSWDVPLLDGYDSEFLPIRRRPEQLSFMQVDNPQVGQRLDLFRPDWVWVHGYSHRTAWRVRSWAQGRAKVVYFGDSELLSERGWPRRSLKRLVLPWFFRRCDSFITIGDNNEAYYRHYGVSEERMFRGAFPVDVRRFQSSARDFDSQERDRMQARFGLTPDTTTVLFSGKFIPSKRPFDLITACARLHELGLSIQCLYLGAGPLEEKMREEVRTLGLSEAVRFGGFLNQAEMPLALSLGDILAICSERDPHPLAVTEAMAVGNAIVASDRVGCVGPSDAARPQENTLLYKCGDIGELADKLACLVADEHLRRKFGEASRRLAWTQDLSVANEALLRAMRVH